MKKIVSAPGALIISLDFELFWGLRDRTTLAAYGANILGARKAVRRLLKLFSDYEIHATWAAVGFLFFENRHELVAALPMVKPDYHSTILCNYKHIKHIGLTEADDPYHFAHSLINLIAKTPFQEVGSHTFSHFYCLEKGQDVAAFTGDIKAAIKAGEKFKLNIKSLVFPRNQYNHNYLGACRDLGIIAYRGNKESYLYSVRVNVRDNLARRGLRLLDAYVNISGHGCYALQDMSDTPPINLPASHFLRPFFPRLHAFEVLRLKRIRESLTHAGRQGLIYHLWWHPHNFGANLQKNLDFLRHVLDHFKRLQRRYGMVSSNMGEMALQVLEVNC